MLWGSFAASRQLALKVKPRSPPMKPEEEHQVISVYVGAHAQLSVSARQRCQAETLNLFVYAMAINIFYSVLCSEEIKHTYNKNKKFRSGGFHFSYFKKIQLLLKTFCVGSGCLCFMVDSLKTFEASGKSYYNSSTSLSGCLCREGIMPNASCSGKSKDC